MNQTSIHSQRLPAAIAAAVLALLFWTGCGPSTESPPTQPPTQTPAMTLADSLGDPDLPYHDAHGEWAWKEAGGMSIRYPKNWDESHNLEGNYIFVISAPREEGERISILLSRSKVEPSEDGLMKVADAIVAEINKDKGLLLSYEPMGEGDRRYRLLHYTRPVSLTGIVEGQVNLVEMQAIWVKGDAKYSLSVNAEDALPAAVEDVLRKMAMSARIK